MPSLLGIDNGLTVTKAVIFDADGSQISVARRRVPQSMPYPRWVERDMAELWRATAEAIREAIAAAGRPPGDIEAVAATAHGDGCTCSTRTGTRWGRAYYPSTAAPARFSTDGRKARSSPKRSI